MIGCVGGTGLAPGPHLDYRVRRGRKFLNPLKLEASRAPSVPKRYLREFRTVR
ncbi:MAG: M23 family peptidase, partial [Candidatus Latescibacterota bacterium]